MKNTTKKLLALLLIACMALAVFTACDKDTEPQPTEPEHIDYVGQLYLDMTTTTKKLAVQYGDRSHIDGDTTHFDVSTSIDPTGKIKVRYLAINTPESTGQIEEWGKAASRFTKEKLSTAHAIYLESETSEWNYDSNGRYLLWVWYQPTEGTPFRCLNIELLQEGLAHGSDIGEYGYSETVIAAQGQAVREKLRVYSDEKDPEFPYGEAASVTLRELRLNAADYEGQKVAVEGVVVYNSNFTAYIQSYDSETDTWYGMQIFYGYNTDLIPVLAQGSLVRVVGVLGNFYGTYQISSLKYNAMRPDDPANTSQIDADAGIDFTEITAATFNGDRTVMNGEEEVTMPYKQLAVASAVTMKNLKVTKIYTTRNGGDSDGAMTLTCKVDGQTVVVRTEVLVDENDQIIKSDAFEGKTINVKGVIEQFEGSYQIKVYSINDVEFVG